MNNRWSLVTMQNVEIQTINNKGRSLICKTHIIKEGFIIECVPITIFCNTITTHLIDTYCGEKFLGWEVATNGVIKSVAVANGLIMLCNHANNPNARIVKNFELDIVKLVAIKDISPNEEITIKYLQRKTF